MAHNIARDKDSAKPRSLPYAGTVARTKKVARRAQTIGVQGEAIACRYLESLGYNIVERNWRVNAGEIDIIAMQERTAVAVEVKTRSGTGYGPPLEAITYLKALRLRRLLAQWLRTHPERWHSCRVDGIGITLRGNQPPKIEHVEGIS
ncbi:YraN family protein [Leucobacter chinensis]|uniref:YraN family protein n=1 Tax=Leucobacter chinensis TaxID=2851010 RepID=UPI001C219DCE|nr:YraN family protein [Leucobacter chinensis]